MGYIAVEEHWNTPAIRDALAALPTGEHDDSVVLNDPEPIASRLLDLGEGRLAAMDTGGVDVAVLSVVTPGVQALKPEQAVPLARAANDAAAAAVAAHPTRFRAFAALPMTDPTAAVVELERAAADGAVGAMVHAHARGRWLDDAAYEPLWTAAQRLGLPVFIHPQIPPNAARAALYQGFSPDLELGLATYGWGWHVGTGLAALRLIVAGTFDRHPELQLILGHFGELALAASDRVNSLGHAANLSKPVADYFATNTYITNSGMLAGRQLRHTLDFVPASRVLYSTDYPFHLPTRAQADELLAAVPDPAERADIASGNARRLFGL